MPGLNGSLKYIIAIPTMAFICLTAVGFIVVYAPPEQKITLITLVLGFLGVTTASLINILGQREIANKVDNAAIAAEEAKTKAAETHKLVDGQMSSYKQQLAAMSLLTAEVARLKGIAEGREAGKEAEHASGLAVGVALQKGIALALPLSEKKVE